MFSSREKSVGAWPAMPPSLNSVTFDLPGEKQASSVSRPPDSAGNVTPYLGLRARLSQIWINRWTVLLLLVLARVLILLASLNDNLGHAKNEALSACTKVEDIGSTMASMPHYLSVGVNQLVSDGITSAVSGLVEMLMLMLDGIEGLIYFIINLYVGTYVCLLTALVHGVLDIGVQVVGDTVDFMNDAIEEITKAITAAVSAATSTIDGIVDRANDALKLIGSSLTAPNLDGITDDVAKLTKIQVNATSFVNDIALLNNSLPTFDDVQEAAQKALSIPFDMVKTALNNSYGNWTFDQSVFPAANKEALTFCSDNSFINDFFDSLFKIANTAKIIAIVVLIVLAILACVVMGWWEIKRYRREQQRARFLTQHGFDPMDVVYMASRPLTSGVGVRISGWFRSKRQLLARWVVAYATSLPALFVLSLAIAGFFSCFCQWVILHAIEKQAPALTSQVGDFAAQVVTTLEGVSTKWANDANGVIIGYRDDINNDVLGYVTNATAAVNDTLNTFDNAINNGINAAFKNTPLLVTVRGIVECVIGNKIEAVEKGLTWVHDHAHVTFPLFPNDTFSVGAKDSINGDSELTSFLASPSSVTTDEISSALFKVTDMLRNNIVQEALISTGLLLVYVIVVLGGVVWALVQMVQPERVRGDGGQRYFTGDGRSPLSPRSMPPRFPEFGGSAPESAYIDDQAARNISNERLGQVQVRDSKDRVGSPTPMDGHWRKSSHGRIDSDT